MTDRRLLALCAVTGLWLAAAVVVAEEPAPPAATAESPMRIEQVAPGVFAALQPTANRFDDANAAFVVRDRDVVLVDVPSRADAARWLLAEIARRTDKPVRYVINTHWHGDHTLGNQYVRAAHPDVTIIAHTTALEDFHARALPQLDEEIATYDAAIRAAEQRLADGVDREGQPLGDRRALLAQQVDDARQALADKRLVKPTPPTLTFERALVLGAEDARIEIRHHIAHTRGDVVVYLPGKRVLISGDLLDDLPFAGHGDLPSWIRTLDVLGGLEVEATVPGHGPVFRDDARRQAVRALLADAWEAARAAVRAGEEAAGVEGRFDAAGHRQAFVAESDAVAARHFDAFIPALLARAFEQAQEAAESSEATP